MPPTLRARPGPAPRRAPQEARAASGGRPDHQLGRQRHRGGLLAVDHLQQQAHHLVADAVERLTHGRQRRCRLGRDAGVVEPGHGDVLGLYPWTLEDDPDHTWENVVVDPSQLVAGYPATPEGQAANFRAIQDVVASAPGGRGVGVVAWEPAWTAVDGAGWDPDDPASGNAWENQAMWDVDGRPLPALDEYAAD
jgi:hypothetical protein